MTDRELNQLREEVKILKKRLDRLYADSGGGSSPLGEEDEQSIVTNVRIDADNFLFEKKTRTLMGQFLDSESGWTSWHLGTTCSPGGTNSEASSGESVAAFATTMALLRLTGAI